jgi:hypothetical protein
LRYGGSVPERKSGSSSPALLTSKQVATLRPMPTRDEAKQHIAQIRSEQYWLDSPTRNPGDNPLMGRLRRALNQLATGIFEHAHHYVFELTQNADDNCYQDGADRFLKFVLLEDDPTGTP